MSRVGGVAVAVVFGFVSAIAGCGKSDEALCKKGVEMKAKAGEAEKGEDDIAACVKEFEKTTAAKPAAAKCSKACIADNDDWASAKACAMKCINK